MGKDRLSLRHLLKRKYQVAPLALVQSQLAAWFDQGFGQKLYQRQKTHCEQNLKSYFGYRLAQLSISPRHSLLENLKPSHKFILSRTYDDASCQCEFDALPLPSDTIDIVLLHHVLDFSNDPHGALIEAARSVTAGGHIVIIGFNPLSIFGLYKWLGAACSDKAVWRHNSLRKGRVVDWLQLLGFQLSYQSSAYDSGEAGDLGLWRQKLPEWSLANGAFYMIIAQKVVSPLQPIKPRYWSPLKVGALAGLKSAQAGEKCRHKKELNR